MTLCTRPANTDTVMSVPPLLYTTAFTNTLVRSSRPPTETNTVQGAVAVTDSMRLEDTIPLAKYSR